MIKVPVDLRTVWDYLRLEPDECFVLSVVYRKSDGRAHLAAASLLAGPPEIAQTGWPGWRLAEGSHPSPRPDELSLPASFVHELDDATVARVVLSRDEAYEWLRAALGATTLPSVAGLASAEASLQPALSPIRVTTHSETPAGSLTWFPRPLSGFYFPLGDPALLPEPSDRWEINATTYFSPALSLLGIGWFKDRTGAQPNGLLFGRFERAAWLLNGRLHTENDLYGIGIGMDLDRVEPADLELSIEEEVAEEIVISEHLRFEDLDLTGVVDELTAPPDSRGKKIFSVALPTLGRGVRRSVRLFHRDRGLLDRWNSFYLAERISFSFDFGTGPQPPNVIGDRRSPQDVAAFLGSVERARRQYAEMRQEGTKNRIFDSIVAGRPVLRQMLERARGEVLVVDPWFQDWGLLENVGDISPRVLLGGGAQNPPPTFTGRARKWHQKTAPFHDRFFLWDGGGVAVGTSASAFGDRLFRMARLNAAESTVLSTQFALWWSDPGFVPV